MLKKIIETTKGIQKSTFSKSQEVSSQAINGIKNLADNTTISAVDIQEKAKEQILNFISNNEAWVKEFMGDKVINETTLGFFYHRLPFPIKLLVSEKMFVGLIIDDDSVIKTTLQKMSTSPSHINAEAESILDECLEENVEKNSVLGSAKDTILAKVTQIAVNTQIKKFGNLLSLTLNSKAKNIDLEVMLDGEHEHLAIHVRNYEIVEEDGGHFIKIQNIVTSRAWIDEAVVPKLEGKSFELPSKYIKLIKMAI